MKLQAGITKHFRSPVLLKELDWGEESSNAIFGYKTYLKHYYSFTEEGLEGTKVLKKIKRKLRSVSLSVPLYFISLWVKISL